MLFSLCVVVSVWVAIPVLSILLLTKDRVYFSTMCVPFRSELSRIPASQTAAVKTEGGGIANPGAVPSNAAEAETSSTSTTSPKCYYDLFGTVNHVGSMESGHYISNVNVDGTWYHCNDSHVSVTTQEAISQQQNEGAYLLFYAARRK